MIACDIAGVRFNTRVAGVVIDSEHVLLNRAEGMDFWFLPGGRVEVSETSEQALVREMAEELHVTVEVCRLLWIVENFFGIDPPYHEVGLYYEMRLPPSLFLWEELETRETVPGAGNKTSHFRWFPLDGLEAVPLMPHFLRHAMDDLPISTEHVVLRR
jgi:8-oxo-dGTP pyrophosphatase MutT (NUDIX family)